MMSSVFSPVRLGPAEVLNRFVFPPIKTAFGNSSGKVTERHLRSYSQIAQEGPGLVILEPVSVTEHGREHPKQLAVHQEESVSELMKVVAGDPDLGGESLPDTREENCRK